MSFSSLSLQEKRMSKATEVMMQYVENLKRTYEKDHAELMEFKKLANQNSSRSCGPSGKELDSCPLPYLGPDGSRLGSHLWGSPKAYVRVSKACCPTQSCPQGPCSHCSSESWGAGTRKHEWPPSNS